MCLGTLFLKLVEMDHGLQAAEPLLDSPKQIDVLS